MSRTPEEAKVLCDLALKLNAHSWDGNPDPSEITDEMYVKRADELVEVATQMSEKDSINEAVLEILHAAQVAPISDVTREAYTQRFGVAPAAATNGHAPEQSQGLSSAASAFVAATDAEQLRAGQPTTSPPSTPAADGPPAAPDQPTDGAHPPVEPAPAAGEDSIEDIYPGYDDAKAKDIKAAILASAASGDLTPEEWERIKVYEDANEGRRTILSLEPEFKAPEPEPVQADPEKLQAVVDAAHPSAPEIFPAQIATGTSTSAPTASSVAFTATGAGAPPSDTAPGDLDVPLEQVYNGEAISRARQEGLPIPAHVDLEQAPIVPVNITDISDQELSALGATFHGLFARAQWLISQEEGRAAAAEHMERETEHDAYVMAYSLHREQIPEEKRTQPTALEAARKQAEKDADTNEKVRTWRSRRVRHGIETRELKALANGWDKAVWRIDKELDRRARAATTARAAT
jgi:hypothetical protein